MAGVISMAVAGTVSIVVLLKTRFGKRLMMWAKK